MASESSSNTATKTNFDRQFPDTSTSSNDKGGEDTFSSPSFFVTRWAIFRLLGLVYWVAFVGAWDQSLGLLGSQGLMPAEFYWPILQQNLAVESPFWGFLRQPSLFWWIPLNDATLEGVAVAGVAISTLIVTGVYVSWLSWALLWLLQFTLISTAQHTVFYHYNWESQLLETTVLAMFLCDLPRLEDWRVRLALFPTFQKPPSSVVLWLFRWLCFRIGMGSALAKRTSNSCWTEGTCLWHYFETQPIPSPLSFAFHFLPKSILTRANDLDQLVQFYASPMVLLFASDRPVTRTVLRTAGLMQVGFRVLSLLWGNFSFLHHLSVVPTLACLDDALYPSWLVEWIVPSSYADCAGYAERDLECRSFPSRRMVDLSLSALVAYLSIPVISNWLQIEGDGSSMNGGSAWDNLRLVNNYGAFGTVGTKRFEAIIFVSSDGEKWVELEFPCKPGSVTRRPCFCAPYHYRLDWNFWFLGFPPHESSLGRRERWLYEVMENILNNDTNEPKPWQELFDPASTKYLQSTQALYARADMYEYQMAAPLWEIMQQYWEGGGGPVAWWKRSYKEPLMVPVGWNPEERLYYAQLDSS